MRSKAVAEMVALTCVSCAARFGPEQGHPLTCPSCGPELGTLDYVYDYGQLTRGWEKPTSVAEGLKTWLPLLPIGSADSLPPLQIGPTPLVSARRLATHIGIGSILLKLDSLLPSLSLKDRATAVALAQAREGGAEIVAAASTGNAASSLAALAAAGGQQAVLFVPRDAPRAKLSQILFHGGVLVRLDSSYDQAFDLSMEVCSREGWYIRSTAVNPTLSEGKKTAALEVACQLAWDVGGMWFVGVGDGCIYGSLYKGLSELQRLGWISRLPPLVGVQAQGASPLVEAWEKRQECLVPWDSVDTYADSIAVGHPRDWFKALRAAGESGGMLTAVPDDLIREAASLLAREAGVLVEPAGASALAGVLALKEAGKIGKSDRAVLLLTGHGLKDPDSLMETVRLPGPIPPDPDIAIQTIRSHLAG